METMKAPFANVPTANGKLVIQMEKLQMENKFSVLFMERPEKR